MTEPPPPRTSTPAPAPTRPRIVVDGRRIGRYELRYEIASGGMATVYLARLEGERGHARAVALKCVHPHLAKSPDLVDMFWSEARIAALLEHPAVCPNYDAGIADGVPYIAMEYIRGETLASVARALASSAIDARELTPLVLRALSDVCEGLHAAHELTSDDGRPLGVVHRDVTPRNLFVGYDGQSRVVDFGIARAEDASHRTSTGHLKGTIGYLSPEYVSEEGIDRRADVWSVGVVAWELLTGRRLFRREGDLETLKAVLDQEVVAPTKVRPELPPEVDAVVMRALCRDPIGRWPSARDLGRALHDAGRALGGPAHPAELANLVDDLFPGLRAEKDAMVAGALGPGLFAAGVSELSDAERSRITAQVLLASAAEPPPPQTVELALPASELLPSRVPTERRSAVAVPPPPRRVPAGALPLVIAGLVGALVASMAALAITGRADDEVSRGREPALTLPALDADGRVHADAIGAAIDDEEIARGGVDVDEIAIDDALAIDDEIAIDDVAGGDVALGDEPTPGRRRVARRGGSGFVNVSARGGWADIFHRGRRIGRTPTRVSLPAGRQVLELRPFGRSAAQRVVVFVPASGETAASIQVQ